MPQKTAHPTQGELTLRLRNVGKQFGAVTALEDIERNVRAGEVVALVGDNGAGKPRSLKLWPACINPRQAQLNTLASP